eukprot:jgi/Tetstr1/438376/TSEL_026942.t1
MWVNRCLAGRCHSRTAAFLASGSVFALHKDDPAAREERAKTGEPLRVHPLASAPCWCAWPPPTLSCRAICTGPLANLALPTVEQLAEKIAATIRQRTNTLPELQHAQWLTDTMTAAGVEMYLHHTEPTLLRVGDDNLCAISLGKEDEEFADTLRLAMALTSPVALLRAIRLRTIVIYLTESEFDPSALLIHPFSQTIGEAGELGGNTGHNQIRRAAMGLRKKAWKTTLASLALRATGRPIYTLTLQLTAHHHSIIGRTRSTDITDQWRKTVSTVCGKIKAAPTPAPTERRLADTSPAPPPADPVQLPLLATPATQIAPQADDDEELELNYEENDSAMEVDTTHGEAAETPATELLAQSSPANKPAIAANLASLAAESHQLSKSHRISIHLERHPSQPTPAGKGKTATTAMIKKKQPIGRSRSDGATRNRIKSKPRLSGTRSSYSEWITDDDTAHPSNSSHQ